MPELFGHHFGSAGSVGFYARNASLFVLPLLAGYFLWKRGWDRRRCLWLALPFAAAAVLANAFPFAPDGATVVLAAIHLPIALWLAVGIAYAGGRWNTVAGRMDFVRFSGSCSSTMCCSPSAAACSRSSPGPCSTPSAWMWAGCWRPGCCRAVRSGRCSSVPGWWSGSRA